MVGWHYQLNGHEFEQALGDGEGQGSLACCSPWGRKELDRAERLNTTTTTTTTTKNQSRRIGRLKGLETMVEKLEEVGGDVSE